MSKKVMQFQKTARAGAAPWRPFEAVALFAAEVAALCFPAIINHGPLLFADTRAYYLGGRAALDKVASLLARAPSGGDAAAQQARGVRSAFYSLFAYVPTALVSLSLVAVLQAAIVAWLLGLTFRLACPGQPRWRRSVFVMVLALASTASWSASMAMPDVFTGTAALAAIVALVLWDAMTAATRAALLAVLAGSVVMHATNLPLALGLLVLAAALRPRGSWQAPGRFVLAGGALAVGAALMLGVGVVGFGQWTLTPQAPPFLLARSLVDGPGRLYLRRHCPEAGFAMCRHLDRIEPASTDDFIWHDNGVYSMVPAKERAALRAEDKRIYVAAALEYPGMQASTFLRNAASQLFSFHLRDYLIPSSATVTATDMAIKAEDPAITQPLWQPLASLPVTAAVAASLGYLLVGWRRNRLVLGAASRAAEDGKLALVLVVATVLAEACVGAISEPAPRYEARVMWLLPMLALLVLFRHGSVKNLGQPACPCGLIGLPDAGPFSSAAAISSHPSVVHGSDNGSGLQGGVGDHLPKLWMPILPFKLNQERRRHIPRQQRKVTNWPAYDASLRQRGSLTVRFTDEAIAAWMAEPRTTRGGQARCSPLAILTTLTLRAVLRLAYRQAEGLIGSIVGLLGLDLHVPDHTTLSRRAATLDVPRPETAGAGANTRRPDR